MYFCSNCTYLFDISKSSNNSKDNDTRTEIVKITEIFTLLDKNDDLTKYKTNIYKEDIFKNKKYIKLDIKDKNKIDKLFDIHVSSGAEFRCNNCNFSKQITETTLLYQINVDNNNVKIKSLEENELLCKNPILPHTKDYTCKNPKCNTHKNNQIKDAVFIRERNNYNINHICCVCFYNW